MLDNAPEKTKMTTIAETLSEIVSKANITQGQQDWAIGGHTRIRKIVDLFEKEKGYKTKVFLTGSYARNTANRPLNDVDIFVAIEVEVNQLPQVVESLTRHLKRHLPTAQLRRQNRSIGIDLYHKDPKTAITFDVIPAAPISKFNQAFVNNSRELDKYQGGYYIPTGDTWIETFPHQAKAKVETANAEHKGRLLPLIKLLKQWNAYHAVENNQGKMKKPLKSYHLEVMCYTVASFNNRDGTYQGDAPSICLLFHLLYLLIKDNVPTIPPGGGTRLDAYLDDPQNKRPWSRDAVVSLLKSALDTTRNLVSNAGLYPFSTSAEWKRFFSRARATETTEQHFPSKKRKAPS